MKRFQVPLVLEGCVLLMHETVLDPMYAHRCDLE